MWTIQELAAAFNALTPTPASLVAACGVLNAQENPASAVDVPATAVRDVLATTGEWGGLMVAIKPNSTVASGVQAVVENLKTLVDTGAVLRTSQPAIQTAAQQSLNVLLSAGLIASGTTTLLEGLWAGSATPIWTPEVVLPAHLQMCQRAGLISSTIPVV